MQESVCDKSAEKCWVFIDNSNLIIQGWKFYGKKNKFAIQDPRMRVDMGLLTDFVINGRSTEGHSRAWLHGSQPPSVDTVWRAIKKKDITVRTFWKSTYTNKEKSVDTGLGSDATENAVKNENVGGTFIFVSGDRDYIFLMEDKILPRGFKIEVFAWEAGLSNNYYDLQRRNPGKVKIFKIDEFADRVCYAQYQFRKGRIPRDRTIVIKFESVNNKKNADLLVQELDRSFHVPFLYQWDTKTERDILFLSAIPAEQKNYKKEQQMNIEDLKELYDTNDEEFLKDVGCTMYDFTVLYNQNKKKLMETAKRIGDYDDENFMTAVEHYGRKDPNSTFSSNNTIDIEAGNIPKDFSGDGWNCVPGGTKQKMDKQKKDCEFEFRCSYGLKCTFKHTTEQKTFFKNVPDARQRWNYKNCLCNYFQDKRCNKERYLCPFAHGVKDAKCYLCNNKSAPPHFQCDCPENTETLPAH